MKTTDKDDRFLEGQIEDVISMAEDRYMITHSSFLSPHERRIAENVVKRGVPQGITAMFSGGFQDAERTMLICIPEYLSIEEENPLVVISAKTREGAKELRHGDYLGSILGLGITRDKVGDILVRAGGADIIVDRSIAHFLMLNYSKAGRMPLSLVEKGIENLTIPEQQVEQRSDTVMSLRLDSLVAAGFRVSRGVAQDSIKKGLVFVDSVEETSVSKEVAQGQKITFRGKGRMVLTEIGGETRKGRTFIEYDRYI